MTCLEVEKIWEILEENGISEILKCFQLAEGHSWIQHSGWWGLLLYQKTRYSSSAE